MEVNVVSKKLIKPCVPTPQTLKMYKLSFTDEVSPPTYASIIFFYSILPVPDYDCIIENLEISLSKILSQFYPFGGRYIHDDCVVDCNDEGAEFVETRAPSNIEMLDFIRNVEPEQLNVLVTRDTGTFHEVTDPLLSVQVTTFKCGGLAIGISFSHRIVDGDSMKTLIAAWANANHFGPTNMTITPSFDSQNLFPFKNLVIGLAHEELPKTRDPNIVAKRLVFDKEMIASLKAKVTRGARVSRVRVVCALIAKALIGVDRAKHEGKPRACLINQAVNMRERTIPPLPKLSFGNLVMQAATLTSKDNMDTLIGFEDLVVLLGEAVDKTVANCGKILGRGEASHEVFLGPIMELIQEMETSFHDTNVMYFTDWTKFGFYEVADFGWGNPVWTGMGTLGERIIVLMDTKEGDGIEAWVHLNKKDITYFEEDEEMRPLFAGK